MFVPSASAEKYRPLVSLEAGLCVIPGVNILAKLLLEATNINWSHQAVANIFPFGQ